MFCLRSLPDKTRNIVLNYEGIPIIYKSTSSAEEAVTLYFTVPGTKLTPLQEVTWALYELKKIG